MSHIESAKVGARVCHKGQQSTVGTIIEQLPHGKVKVYWGQIDRREVVTDERAGNLELFTGTVVQEEEVQLRQAAETGLPYHKEGE